MDKMRFLLVAAVICLAGCHESLGLVGDARTDTAVDAPWDTGWDPDYDPGVDPGYDIAPEPAWDTGVDPEPPPPCPPPNPYPDGPMPYWTTNIDPWPTEVSFSKRCDVEDVAVADDNAFTIFVSCLDETGVLLTYTISVRSEAPFWLYLHPGEEVIFDYVADPIWWINRWFALRYTWGDIIVAGVDAEMLVPAGVDADDFYQPLDVSLFDAHYCPPEDEMCGSIQRRGLRVGWGGITADFVDRTYGTMGFMESVQVQVGETHGYIEMYCDDVPYEWVSALFVMVPEG
jgi:hypothetical protein